MSEAVQDASRNEGEGPPPADAPRSDATTEVEAETPVYPLSEPIPDVLTKLSPPGVLARLDRASRRGKLPGFTGEHREGLCAVSAFGEPFDRLMIIKAEQNDDGRTRLRFSLKLDLRIPALLLGLLAITVWPGEPLTHSLLVTYFDWYNSWTQGWFRTWMWYLPLTVPAVPLTWRWAMKKSNETTHQSAHEAVRKIADAIGGDIVPPKIRR